jgi:hypothetical protein
MVKTFSFMLWTPWRVNRMPNITERGGLKIVLEPVADDGNASVEQHGERDRLGNSFGAGEARRFLQQVERDDDDLTSICIFMCSGRRILVLWRLVANGRIALHVLEL